MANRSLTFLLSILFCLLVGCTPTHPQASPTSVLPLASSQLKSTSTSSTPGLPTPSLVPSATPTSTSISTVVTTPSEAAFPITSLAAGETPNLTQIRMVSKDTGWGIVASQDANDHLFVTADGGQTLQEVSPPELALSPDQGGKRLLAFALDEKHAWATYYPRATSQFSPSPVWFTTDGGASWESSQPLEKIGFDTYYAPTFLEFIDRQHGWLLVSHDPGAGHLPISIYRTINGGLTWQRVNDPIQDETNQIHVCCQSGLVFLDPQVGVITSSDGPISIPYINWTFDGGFTWQVQELPPPKPGLFDQTWCGTRNPQSPQEGFLSLLVSCLGISSPAGLPLTYLYTTSDQGQSWRIQPLPEPPIDQETVSDVRREYQTSFLSPANGWLYVKDDYADQQGNLLGIQTTIYHTQDGGRTWQQIKTVYWAGQFSFVNPQEGWAVASVEESQVLVQTEDAGRTWQLLEPIVIP